MKMNTQGFCSELVSNDDAARALRIADRALDSSTNAVFVVELHSSGARIQYVNPAFSRITGYIASEILGRHPGLLLLASPEDSTPHPVTMFEIEEGTSHGLCRRKDGSSFWMEIHAAVVSDDGDVPTHLVVHLIDKTDARLQLSRLRHQSLHDGLTGLPNRQFLQDRLEIAVTQAERLGEMAALLWLDLDQFKLVNSSFGHSKGDELLRQVAQRLLDSVDHSSTVARFGGDEFVILLSRLPDADTALHTAGRLIRVLESPFMIEGHEIYTRASAGVALIPRDGRTAEDVLMHADTAMHAAKLERRSTFRLYDKSMSQRARSRELMARDLRSAIAQGQLEVYYQPKLNPITARLTGFEALLRWKHPDVGFIPPDLFIPIAEETGLIERIGHWVLCEACRQVYLWQLEWKTPLVVAVNASAVQFRQPNWLKTVEAALEASGLPPSCLQFEITEGLLLQDTESANEVMNALRSLGISLALDDFGSGYSSLMYLSRFPLNVVKIDREFITNITGGHRGSAIAKAIIELSHILGLQVVAEGVENPEQLAFLCANSCDEVQGFLLGKPLSAKEAGDVWGSRVSELQSNVSASAM